MTRKLYNLCTLGSLLLLCGSLWWWNHSSRNTDQVTLHGLAGASLQVTGSGGQVTMTKGANRDAGGGELRWSTFADGGSRKLLSTSFNYANNPSGTTLIVPSWVLVLTFAVLPSLWMWSKLHRKGGKKKSEAH